MICQTTAKKRFERHFTKLAAAKIWLSWFAAYADALTFTGNAKN